MLDVSAFSEIDRNTFSQLLELEEDEPGFLLSLVQTYVEQAESTLVKLSEAVKNKDMLGASKLGHFLKGSSASIGLLRLSKACELIQLIGKGQPINGQLLSQDDSLIALEKLVQEAGAFYLSGKNCLTQACSNPKNQ